MSNVIKADYEKILALQDKMNNNKKKLINAMNEAKDSVDKLDNKDYWRGDGYENYRNKMANFKQHFNAFVLDLTNMTEKLDEVVQKYKDVDKTAMEQVTNGG